LVGVCTVILGWRLHPDAAIVVAANRDELLARPSDPPMLLADQPPRWGGRDRLAGGTWLAVDPAGRIGAVTNRHPGGRLPSRDSSRHSRGALPLDVLRGDDAAAYELAARLDPATYNPVNVVYASPTSAWCASLDDDVGRSVTVLEPGVHVLSEQDVDDPNDPKTQAILAAAEAVTPAFGDVEGLVAGWREILQTHEAAYAGSPACIHAEQYGTVSSATVVVGSDAGGVPYVKYEHAEGPPCRNPYRPVLPIPG